MAKMKNRPIVDRILFCLLLSCLGHDAPVAKEASDPASVRGGLQLNELLASNQSGLQDEQGNTSDWLELANTASQPIELTGHRLTDDLDDLEKWAFPKHRIFPGGHLLVWMSGSPAQSFSPHGSSPTVRTIPFDRTLIPSGAEWKYRSFQQTDEEDAATEPLPKNWMQIDYVDDHLPVG